MDKLKLRLTIQAAQKQAELLEQALDRGDNKTIGAALHSLRRELATLAQIAEVPPFIPSIDNQDKPQ